MTHDDGWAPYARPQARLPIRHLLLTVTVVVVAAVLGARLLVGVLDRVGDDRGAVSARGPAAEAEVPGTTGATGLTDAAEPTEPTEQSGQSGAAVRCWDGDAVAEMSACSLPEGRPGLAFVFPAMRDQDCREPRRGGEPGRVLMVRCSAVLASGARVVVSYAQWSSVEAGSSYFDGKVSDRVDSADVLAWSGESDGADTLLHAAFIYRDAPFSASWYARTPAQMSLALDTGVVVSRPADELRGEPTP